MWATKERVSCLHSTDDGPKSPKPVCYLIKELKPEWFMCQLRLHVIFPHSSELASFFPLSQVMSLDVICNQFNSWANIPKRKLPSSASSKWRVGSVASNRNPANNWCPRWVTALQQSKSRVLRKGRSQEMSRLKDRKFKAKGKMAKHKPKPWQKVKRGKETQTVTGIEAQGKKRSSVTQNRGTA